MGGHGGLNILPQKRWNVYNFENREKVRKDEEEAAREEAIRQQKARREETEFKLEKLRQGAQSKRRRVDGGPSSINENESQGAIVVRGTVSVEGTLASKDEAERPRHINLFAEYEAREKEGQGKVRAKEEDQKDVSRGKKGKREFQDHRDRQLEKKDGKPTGEPADDNYRLGHGAVDSVEQQSSMSTKSKKSVEDLRAERLVREQEERDKARKVVRAKAGNSLNNGYTRLADGRLPHYHASFGNAR
ncbi:hypothetical protein AXG93_4170s1130 [Marchantia polymorpha subsp. ruderalis]|uniref:CBF1-interacting co-repressor CIR N-terminal domain-containing protein n=1 Tax=Marchantia polymorpha subsp. ruderalis TaxID=1480154 RepID=A0A176VMW5_MARPO|nr:hypothetical protein AXG93_4170s1130 [Marchantia polymorpha subsp. ruderalis]